MNRNSSYRAFYTLPVILALIFPAAFAGFGQITPPITVNPPTPYPPPRDTNDIITITATDPQASESGDTGTFTIRRVGNTNSVAIAAFSITGTASNGVDYVKLPNVVTLAPGVTSAKLEVVPIPDTLIEGDETVTLRLVPPTSGAPISVINAATVVIHDANSVGTNRPPLVAIQTPSDGFSFPIAPTNILIGAAAGDLDGTVQSVQFFANGTSLGTTTNYLIIDPVAGSTSLFRQYFLFTWSNAPAGSFALTALATDNGGATGRSVPVNITIGGSAPPPPPPVVTIYAPDPIAIRGTNCPITPVSTVFTNFISGTNTATFLVKRDGPTNEDLTVFYSIGGTASNGVDYVKIPDYATIPAGKRFALITILPLPGPVADLTRFETVILALKYPITAGPRLSYVIGWPDKAGATILDDCHRFIPLAGKLPGNYFHLNQPAPDGENYTVEVSANLEDWIPVASGTVVKGSIQFIDPESSDLPARYYRVVPSTPPDY